MKRIVIKLGTGVLTLEKGIALDPVQFDRLASDFAALVADGYSVIVVSSGAITAGLGVLGLSRRPGDLHSKQACASVGQPRLIGMFDGCLAKHGLHAAQLLLTHDDIDSRRRRANARNTLERLLETRTVVPIINENDSVAVEEINFGDNDQLSAEVALMAGAQLLILLTSSDGLLRRGRRVPLVTNLDDAFAFVTPDKGEFSVGGMRAKLEAVRLALDGGIETVIASGRLPDQIAAAVAGGDAGTRFPVPSNAHARPARSAAA